ncbi:hypothetical protein JK358_10720 [Nocardia sp. 2]|uniref:Uncharacterized protein n=1 Tax=Nocardia acididurans TaxID=2802282 RepID=A0ABS1M489_9NOCA|nr:hypothetical protein [Nocardia acididurans]MBL1074865.1 hypothetical protein [Nocardia acididurans]
MTRIADRVALLLAADPVAAPTVSAPSTTLRALIGMTIATGQHARYFSTRYRSPNPPCLATDLATEHGGIQRNGWNDKDKPVRATPR